MHAETQHGHTHTLHCASNIKRASSALALDVHVYTLPKGKGDFQSVFGFSFILVIMFCINYLTETHFLALLTSLKSQSFSSGGQFLSVCPSVCLSVRLASTMPSTKSIHQIPFKFGIQIAYT